MSEDQKAPPITKVTITTPGTTVTIEAAETLTVVANRAGKLHREAVARAGERRRVGFGGTP